MESGAKNTEKCEALWCELQFCRWRESHVTKKVEEDIVTTADNLILRNHTWTHVIHQMSLASHTSTLFHSSLNLLDVSLIKPHLHINTTTHIPHQPSKPKHHITHLILQFFPASSLAYLNHFIPNLFQSQSKITLVVPQASTIFHLSNFLLTLIGFKYFLKSIQFFLGCIDFWNHILLQKKCFFCFFGFWLYCI